MVMFETRPRNVETNFEVVSILLHGDVSYYWVSLGIFVRVAILGFVRVFESGDFGSQARVVWVNSHEEMCGMENAGTLSTGGEP